MPCRQTLQLPHTRQVAVNLMPIFNMTLLLLLLLLWKLAPANAVSFVCGKACSSTLSCTQGLTVIFLTRTGRQDPTRVCCDSTPNHVHIGAQLHIRHAETQQEKAHKTMNSQEFPPQDPHRTQALTAHKTGIHHDRCQKLGLWRSATHKACKTPQEQADMMRAQPRVPSSRDPNSAQVQALTQALIILRHWFQHLFKGQYKLP